MTDFGGVDLGDRVGAMRRIKQRGIYKEADQLPSTTWADVVTMSTDIGTDVPNVGTDVIRHRFLVQGWLQNVGTDVGTTSVSGRRRHTNGHQMSVPMSYNMVTKRQPIRNQ